MSGMVSKVNNYIINLVGMPLYIGLICGGVCVLVDIDHPISVAVGIADGRFAHPLYFILSCVIIIGCCTFVGRLLYKAFLRKEYA